MAFLLAIFCYLLVIVGLPLAFIILVIKGQSDAVFKGITPKDKRT